MEIPNRGGGMVSVSNLVDKIKKKEYLPLSSHHNRSISCLSQQDNAKTAAEIMAKLWNISEAKTQTCMIREGALNSVKVIKKRSKLTCRQTPPLSHQLTFAAEQSRESNGNRSGASKLGRQACKASINKKAE